MTNLVDSPRAPDAMSEIYMLVYAETTLLITGSSIAAVFPLFFDTKSWFWGASGKGSGGSKNETPLRTFGQGTFRKRKGFLEEDETTLTRGEIGEDIVQTSMEGIVKTTDVEQTWTSADAESQAMARSRQLGLAPGTV